MTPSSSNSSFLSRVISPFVSRDISRRDLALDAFRGLMIVGMVMVNHPPAGGPHLPPFVHSPWHGWTLADTVFPGFLVAVGISIGMAMVGRQRQPSVPTVSLYPKVFRRFAILMALNFALVNFPYYEVGNLKFSGTLALIAWCYMLVVLIYLHTDWRTQIALALFAISLQWALYTSMPVAGVGPAQMTPDNNAARFVDQKLLEPLFGAVTGPLGDEPQLLPILGAVSTTLIGLLAAQCMSSLRDTRVRTLGLLATGCLLIALGSLLDAVMPINKVLWTGTYSLFMSGVALALLALLSWMSALRGLRACLKPLQIAGVNALFFYVFAQSLQRVLVYGRIPGSDGSMIRLKDYIYQHFVQPWLPGEIGTLVYTLVFLCICYIAVSVLYKRRIFLKL